MAAHTLMTVFGAALAMVLTAGEAWAGPRSVAAVKTAKAEPTVAAPTAPTVRSVRPAADDGEVCESKGWKEFIANYKPEGGQTGVAVRVAPPVARPVVYTTPAQPAAAKGKPAARRAPR